MYVHYSKRLCSKQRGFALVVALIFLVLMTLLAMSASQYALMQERMAGGLRNAQQARMSAETALRGAEYKLWLTASQPGARLHCSESTITSDDGCVVYRPYSPLYAASGKVTRFRSSPDWVPGIGVSYLGPTRSGYTRNSQQPTAALAENPVYIIEDLGEQRAPGTGVLHESGNTGPNNVGQGHLNVHIYRITARATGGNPHTVRIVQSTFDAPANP